MFEVTHNGRLFAAETTDELRQMGVPEDRIVSAMTDMRGVEVKGECRRRIYAVASSETQMNMAAATAVISGKPVADRTAEEQTILADVESAIGWIAAMRAAVVTLSADDGADFRADAAWPDVPPAALAMIQNF